MGFDYGFEYAVPEMSESAMGVVTGILLILWFLAMGFSIVMYVLNAVGMYRIAKRRGIHHAWLAWVPIGCNWLLGSISDHYQYVVKQKTTSRRKVLLILSLVMVAVSFLFIGGVVGASLAANTMAQTAGMAVSVVLMGLGYLGMMALAIAITVFCYIAYYDLFRSSKPNNAVLFLVLSVIFNVTLAFFVFACGNSDEGMPAKRRPQAAPEIPCIPAEEEAWEDDFPAEEEEPSAVEGEIVEDTE